MTLLLRGPFLAQLGRSQVLAEVPSERCHFLLASDLGFI